MDTQDSIQNNTLPKNKLKKVNDLTSDLTNVETKLKNLLETIENDKSMEVGRKELYASTKKMLLNLLKKNESDEKIKKQYELLETQHKKYVLMYNENLKKNNLLRKKYTKEKTQLTKKIKSITEKNSVKTEINALNKQKTPESLKNAFNITEEYMTRPQFTVLFYKYVKENNLKDEKNGQILRANDTIKNGLELTEDEFNHINTTTSHLDKNGLNFFNLQRKLAQIYNKYNVA
jgi:hypothetical protein